MRPTPKATEQHAHASAEFADKLSQTRALLRSCVTDFSPLKQASSLGAEDVVITHLINAMALDIPVFVLDTGALHHETLALLERTQAHSRASIEVYRPEHLAVIQWVRERGQDAIYRSIDERKSCCDVRKLEPLKRALQGQRAWITGLRREQSANRGAVEMIDKSELTTQGRVKLNPLADWTWGDVWHYIATEGVDYNPLHDEFFPSIGCAPCTRAISLGEDFRAGRWWWEDEAAKECGLHATHTPETTPKKVPA